MTLGFTLVCTASRISRPARSMAVAVCQGKIDAGLAGGDHGVDDALHVAAGQQVAFHFRLGDLQAGARRLNAAVDDDRRR